MAGERELEYSYSLDNANLKRDADEAKNVFKSISDAVEKESVKIDNAFERGVSEANKNIKSLGVTLKKDSDGITEYFNTISSAVEVNKQVISELEAEYKRLGEQISGMRKSKKKSALVEEYESIGAVINTAKGSLSAFEAENSKISRGYKELGKELSNVQSELMRMRSAGQQNTQEYRNLEQEAAKLSSTISSVQSNVRKLASERSTVQGLTDGLRGLTGAFALGSGVVGLFSKENQNLEKIMVRLQSAMSIAIGVQEVSNALDKNSAFQTVALTKAKTLYTASLGRLSVVLGISTVAAQALMGALTLGLSVAIGVAIAAWDKYSKKQEEAAKKIKDRLEIEKEGYATMLKTRFELDNATKSIESFNGTKEEEKNKVEELNRKYGESFGYYNTLDDWYNALIKKGDDYVNSLFMQIKVQNLLTKAVEADERARQIAAEGVQTGDFKWYDVVNPLNSFRGTPSFSAVDRANKSYKDRLEKANKEREDLLKEAQELEDKRNNLASSAGIGGFKDNRKAESNSDKKLQEEKDRIEREIKEREKQIKEYEKSLAAQFRESEFSIRASRLNNLDDSFEKERQLIDLNYKKTLYEIEKQEDEMIKALTKKRELEHLNKYPDGKTPFDPISISATDLTEEQKATLKNNEGVAEAIRFKALADTEKKYTERQEKAIRDRHEKFVDLRIRQARALAEKEQIALSEASYKWESDREKDLLEAQKESILAEIERLKSLTPDPNVQLEIEQLKNKILELNGALNKIPANKIKEIGSAISSVIGSFSGLGGDLGKLFGQLSSGISQVSTAMADQKNGKGGFEQWGSSITAVIQNTVTLINALTDAAKKRKEAEREFYLNSISLAHQYALALNEQLRVQGELSGGQFVRNYAAEINTAFEAATEAVGKYQEAVSKLSEGQAKQGQKNAVNWGVVATAATSTAATGAIIGASAGSVVPIVGTIIGAAVGAVVGGIVGIFAGKKKKDVFGGLLDIYPELIDEQDNLNKALAEQLIATNQLDEKTKLLVQNALDWDSAVETATEGIRDIVGVLAGDLGSSLQSAVVDAWKAGEDAADRMFKSVNDSIANLVENLTYGVVFAKTMKKFEDELTKALSPSGTKSAEEVYKELYENLQLDYETFKKLMNESKKAAENAGFTPWEDTTRTGISKGLQGMTQDTADELNGRFTVIQGHTFIIANTMPLLLENSNVANGHLFAIRENTARLESIENFMRRNTEASEDIRDRGIKML